MPKRSLAGLPSPSFVAVMLLTAVSLPVAAQTMVPKLDQDGRKGDMARLAKEQAAARFDAADADKDGKLSREEVAKTSQFLSDNFDARDGNKDGFLSWEEYVGHNRWPKDR